MNKIVKTAGLMVLCAAVLLLVLLLILVFVYLSKRPFVAGDYAEKAETGGEIEAKYMKRGPYDVAHYEEAAMQGFGKYQIYYPAGWEEDGRRYPVVVFANGSGAKVSKYPALLEHMASWGFIAIGTEEEYDWNGFASEMCVRHLMRLNEAESINGKANVFYGKVDLDRVGITGHSQGGVGVFSALTIQEHADLYKAAAALSPTNQELAENLEWGYDVTQVRTPILLLSGAGGGDDWVVTGEQLAAIYEAVGGDKVMARRRDTDHGSMLYSADGYVTAWFMWLLQGDMEAAAAFTGETAEMMGNAYYQDQQSNLGGPAME